jgi:predicted nucleotidyltransferase component of viral defense system
MFSSATQLKDWIKNKSARTGVPTNTLLQSYMMERLLERISLSLYRGNIILKGGFLIAAMIGIDRRSTMDMDTTIKGLPASRNEIEKMLGNILSIDAGDHTAFEIQNIQPIRDVSAYDDFRVSLQGTLYTIRVNMKIDITVGDIIIPQEIEYSYKLMFEDRTINVMAYNIYTILAEKIETILIRNVVNSRARDFYDAYILLALNKDTLSRPELLHALQAKATERGSLSVVEDHTKHLRNIIESPDIAKVWDNYSKKYPYAKGITLADVISLIGWIFE